MKFHWFLSPVQATGWRMVLTGVWLHLMLTFAYLANHINEQTGTRLLSLPLSLSFHTGQ